MDTLLDSLTSDLKDGRKIALGFECPLFVPVRTDPRELTSQRSGENGRPWSAGAGLGAMGVGIVQVIWILEQLIERVASAPPVFFKWNDFEKAEVGLFLWEAFVTGAAKSPAGDDFSHQEDAAIGLRAFNEALPNPEESNAIQETSVFSLIGSALLRSGWTNDVGVLSEPCLVFRAEFTGNHDCLDSVRLASVRTVTCDTATS